LILTGRSAATFARWDGFAVAKARHSKSKV
jgi:hypothetical protein